jgi:hypothetical protein
MKINVLVLFICLFAVLILPAQEKPVSIHKNAIGIVPQYAIINGFRTDFDFSIASKSNQWMVVSPQIYISPENPNLFDYDNMWGLGIELQHRFYLEEGTGGFYLGYGPMFQFFNIQDELLHTELLNENGIEYTVLRYGKVNTRIYKGGLNATGGYQFVILNSLYLDFYLGTGIRLSFDDTGSGSFHRIYNDWWGDYGYSGTLITAGFRFGMTF